MFGRNETNWKLPKNSHDCGIIKIIVKKRVLVALSPNYSRRPMAKPYVALMSHVIGILIIRQ